MPPFKCDGGKDSWRWVEISRLFKRHNRLEQWEKLLFTSVLLMSNFDSCDAKYMARNRVRSWDETSFTMQNQACRVAIHLRFQCIRRAFPLYSSSEYGVIGFRLRRNRRLNTAQSQRVRFTFGNHLRITNNPERRTL